jgi:transposase
MTAKLQHLPRAANARVAGNRFVRWGRAGVWDQIMDALAETHDAAVQMIDTFRDMR